MIEIQTPQGAARAQIRSPTGARGALVLGHGAAGGISSPDLVAVADAACSDGFQVALVEQPYKVAGRRSPPQAPKLDEAWTEVVARLYEGELAGLPLVAGGRSLGARVACRTASATGAVAVLCLAFPLHPPGRPDNSRQPELDAVAVPTLVVQGESDPFGMPAAGPRREVVAVPGNHSLKNGLDEVVAAAREWLGQWRA